MDKPFQFDRKYIKAAEREKVNYSWDKVLEEFHSIVKRMPIQENLEWYTEPCYYTNKETGKKEILIEGETCHNSYEQIIFLAHRMLEDGYDHRYKAFLRPYATMFILMKNYSDDELCYLYTTGMEFISPWDEEIEDPRKLLAPEYTQKLTRKVVVEKVVALLILDILLTDYSVWGDNFEYDFVLEDYEEELEEEL